MNKPMSQAKLLKHRVRQIQGRAKFVGIIYLLGIIALLALSTCVLGVSGSCLSSSQAGGVVFPIISFYLPVLHNFTGAGWSVQGIIDCITVSAFALMVILIFVYTIVALSKLNWLFKRRASYVYGFNRNMYAMDALAKCFSNAFFVFILCQSLILLLSGVHAPSVTGVKINLFGYLGLALGLAVHFVGGIFGGTVTTFTVGKRIQEEPRPNGLFMHVVRNAVQVVAAFLMLHIYLQSSQLLTAVTEILGLAFPASHAAMSVGKWIFFAMEILGWVALMGLTHNAISAKEFDREGMAAQDITQSTVWIIFAFVMSLVWLILPSSGLLGKAVAISSQMLLAVVVSGVALLMNWILQDRPMGEVDDGEETSIKEYIEENKE